MRANPTDCERKLWALLRDRRLGGDRWRRQLVIDDRYIVDFVCFAHRRSVEALTPNRSTHEIAGQTGTRYLARSNKASGFCASGTTT
jgi:very-short-patch-repair endonuclease